MSKRSRRKAREQAYRNRDTRVAFRAEDMPADLVEALMNADYSHLDSKLNDLMK